MEEGERGVCGAGRGSEVKREGVSLSLLQH